MKRRTLLSGTAAAGTVGLSGCLNSLLGSVTSLESTPAGIDPSALDSTDYEAVGVEKIVTEEDVEVQSEPIAVTSYLSNYEKRIGIDGVDEQATATVAVFSTPKLEVAGETLNPVGEMSSRDVVELIGDNYDSIDNIEHDEDEIVTILEQSVTKSRFIAEASFAGIPIELDLHVTEAVERDDDLVLTIGVYPRQLRSTEADNVRTLTEAVSPDPADAPADTNSTDDSDSQESTTSNDDSENSTENESTGDASTNNESTTDESTNNESTDDSDGSINITDSPL